MHSEFQLALEELICEYDAYRLLRSSVFANHGDALSEALGGMLRNPSTSTLALEISFYCSPDRRKTLLSDFLRIASYQCRDLDLARTAILSLPRDWLIENIESSAEDLISKGTYEEYIRLLELFSLIDKGLTRRLAERAARQEDVHIREVGRELLDQLENS